MDDKLIAELRELRSFLWGESAVDGVWFGDEGRDPFGQVARFWWRKHLDRIDRALQALEGAWRPISEAPRDGTKIDVWSRDARYTDVFWSDIQEWWCIEGDYGPEEPTPLHVAPAITHFKSLPDPPRDEPIDGDRSREAKPILPKPIEGRGP